MSKNIELVEVVILDWKVSLVQENVHISYGLADSEGIVWVNDIAIFWLNMPETFDEDGNPIPPPESWYDLPPAYWAELLALTTSAHNAIFNRILS